MQQILLKEDYINTFNEKQKKLLENYYKIQELIGKLGITEMSKKTKIPINSLSNWVRKNPKIPFSVRAVKKAEERNYFRINLNSEKAENLAYMVGYNLGDGNIHRKLCNTWFYGTTEDLPIFNSLLKELSVQGKIHHYKINNGKMCVSDNSFTRLMVALGCTVGDKTNNNVKIPNWIKNTERKSKIKKKFLQGLFDSELNTITLLKRGKLAFQTLKLYNIKTNNFIQEGKEYLEEIKKLLKEFEVSSGEVKEDRNYIRSRDGANMLQLYFTIPSNYINLNTFISNIGFLYNSKRKREMDKYKNIIKEQAQKEREKLEKYKKINELRNQGLSAYRIAKDLDLAEHYAKSWIYKHRKPMERKFE